MIRLILLVIHLSLFSSMLAAQDLQRAIVRAEIEPRSGTLGQPLRLRVTVLVPTWFVKPSIYPAFELPNAATRLPPNSSFNVTERIAGENWAGIVRDYVVYPQSAARYALTGESIEVNYADPATNEAVTERIAVPGVTFAARIPTGAEKLSPFLAGTSLTLEQSTSPSQGILQAGDAIERRVTARIEGTPAMFLPPLLDVPVNDGITFYPREPRISDKPGARSGAVTGQREESALYVFRRGGISELPEIKVRWWNRETQAVETTHLPAIVLKVESAPGTTGAQSPAGRSLLEPNMLKRLTGSAVLTLLLAFVLWHFRAFLKRWALTRRRDWRMSEPYAFRKLQTSLRQRDVGKIYPALRIWRSRIAPDVTMASFVILVPELNALGRSHFGPEKAAKGHTRTRHRKLRAQLKALRSKLLDKPNLVDGPPGLAPLYPRSKTDAASP